MYQYSDSKEQICDYCGARFRVDIPHQPGCEEAEEYFCPECNQMFKTRASLTPRVTLLSPRTDGKKDIYPYNKFDLD